MSRYAVYGQRIIQDAAIVTTFGGNPTDITYRAGLAAVIDADGTNSHVSVFKVDGDGNFSLKVSPPSTVSPRTASQLSVWTKIPMIEKTRRWGRR